MRQGASILILFFAGFSPASAWAQPGTTVFAGFDHTATGSAVLTVDPSYSSLLIDGLGSGSRGGAVYQLDAEAGKISFGDGIRGARPAQGNWTVRAQYRYGGGATPQIDGIAAPSDPLLVFDFLPLTSSSVQGTFTAQGAVVVDDAFTPSTTIAVAEWPGEIALGVVQGEMVLGARWDAPVSVLLPDQQIISCDEAYFVSLTGAMLSGEEIGTMQWEGFDLGSVEILGERFFEGGEWYEIEGDLSLNRTPLGHELTHAIQQGPGGAHVVFPPEPICPPGALQLLAGQKVEQLGVPEDGTRMDALSFATLPNSTRSRIPTHSAEWTDLSGSDPGMTLLGGFVELGALSYTVQIFDDGVLIDSESGLGAAVARAKQYVLQYNQSDFDFLNQRASAQMDLGADVEIEILASVPRTVVGDRVHIVPEQLQIFPSCIEAVATGMRKFSNITLKRGVVGIELPPARVFGLAQQSTGDALLRLQNGSLLVDQLYWGPSASGPLTGGVRTPVAGLQGFRWRFAGTLDPGLLPPDAKRSFLLHLSDANGLPGTAGMVAEIQNGRYAIGADFAALGSSDFELEIWNGPQMVYGQVVPSQTKVLVAADFAEVAFLEHDEGLVDIVTRYDEPQLIEVGVQTIVGTYVVQRPVFRDQLTSVLEFESLIENTPELEIIRAGIRRDSRWLSAVGDVDFGDPSADPLRIAHLDPAGSSGVETDDEESDGSPYAELRVEDPALLNVFDGDEQVMLQIQEDEEGAAKLPPAPAWVLLDWDGSQWVGSVDFGAAGYTAFRVLADGAGELYGAPSPVGPAFDCAQFPTQQIVQGAGDELSVRLSFEAPVLVSTPGLGPVSTSAITVIASGANRTAFPGGTLRFLCDGIQTTGILPSRAAVAAPEPTRTATRSIELHAAAPNPFNPRTSLSYELGSAGQITLDVYDLAGRHVRNLLRGHRPAGAASTIWDGRDAHGREVGSGVYLVRLRAAREVAQQRVVLLR